jgi:hypothetical protein
MYENVNLIANVKSLLEQDLQDHSKRIESKNVRSKNPINSQSKVYQGNVFLKKYLPKIRDLIVYKSKDKMLIERYLAV